MHVISVLAKPHRHEIGVVDSEGNSTPPLCRCGSPVIISVKSGEFDGAICPDCGESYQILYEASCLAKLLSDPNTVVVGDKCPWKPEG